MKKIKFFEEVFMSFAPLALVICGVLSLKDLNPILAMIAVILLVLVFWKRKNYTQGGYEPNGE